MTDEEWLRQWKLVQPLRTPAERILLGEKQPEKKPETIMAWDEGTR
jgi:hypothetical protein